MQEGGAISGLASLPHFFSGLVLVFWQVGEFWEQFCSWGILSSGKEDITDKPSVLILYGIPQKDDPDRVGMVFSLFYLLSIFSHVFKLIKNLKATRLEEYVSDM